MTQHDPDTLRGFAALCRAGLIPPPPPGPRYEIRCDPCGAVLAEGERGHPPDVIHEQPDAHVCPPGPRYPAVRVRLVGDGRERARHHRGGCRCPTA